MAEYETVPLSSLRRDNLYDDEVFNEDAIRRLENGYACGLVAVRVWRDYVVAGGRLFEFLKREEYSEIRVIRVLHPADWSIDDPGEFRERHDGATYLAPLYPTSEDATWDSPTPRDD